MAGSMFASEHLHEGMLSAGSWRVALPLSNALVRDVHTVARSTDATTASTKFRRTYSAAVTLRLFALVGSNLQSAATWRIRAFSDAGFSVLVHSTGWLTAWPVQWATGVLPSGHPNAATRLLTNAQIASRRWDVLHIAAADVTARYWEIEIDDTTNTAGYVDIGFLVMAPVYQPGASDNVGTGAGFGRHSTTETGESRGGTRLVNAQRIGRTHTLVFPALSLDESTSVLLDMLDTLGLDGFVYFVFDPDCAELLQRTSYLAQVESLTELQYVQYGQQSVPVKLREVV